MKQFLMSLGLLLIAFGVVKLAIALFQLAREKHNG